MFFFRLTKKSKSCLFCRPNARKEKSGKFEILVSDEAEEGRVNVLVLTILALVLYGLLLVI